MAERKIGKVISIDSFRVVIQLDSDLKSLYKSGFNDIYEIARINSYVIIPIGTDRIVALITRVKVQDETEIEKRSGSITLPKAERYLIATMLGTIEKKGDKYKYSQGVYNYPILDNPVWYVLNEDLDSIFDTEVKEKIDYSKDFYLPVGTSPAFSDYDIRINPDQLFAKHAAVLGNTGSGKSCTVSTLIQSLFRFDFPNEEELKSAHFIIFDTNGEYKNAFIEDGETSIDFQDQVNTFYISSENLKVPYWFMNYDDMDYLFQPSALTQAPIFKRAIGLAKEGLDSSEGNLNKTVESHLSRIIETDINDLFVKKYHKPRGQWVIDPSNDLIEFSELIPDEEEDIKDALFRLGSEDSDAESIKIQEQLREAYNEYLNRKEKTKVDTNRSIDLPTWFNFEDLITKFIEYAIEESEASASRIRENVSTLKLRLHSFLTDDRIADPLLLDYDDKEDFDEDYLLSNFLMFILGEFFQIPKEKYGGLFSDVFSKNVIDESNRSQVTIIDLSLLSFEVLETITGLLGRLVMDFVSRLDKRGAFPTVLVLEEAQNYIPEKNRTDRVSISKKVGV